MARKKTLDDKLHAAGIPTSEEYFHFAAMNAREARANARKYRGSGVMLDAHAFWTRRAVTWMRQARKLGIPLGDDLT